MSGVEIAGLSLGTLSYAIQPSEAASVVCRHIKDAPNQLVELERRLRGQQIQLSSLVELTLKDELPASEIAELLSNPRSLEWQSPKIERAIDHSIGSQSPLFLLLLSDILEKVKYTDTALATAMKRHSGSRFALLKDALPRSSQRKTLADVSDTIDDIDAHLRIISTILKVYRLEGLQPLQREAQEHHQQAQEFENNCERNAITVQRATGDIASLYSVESEIETEAASLSFLHLSLQSVDAPQRGWQDHALLDSGATHCAMSLGTALQFGLKIEKTKEKVITTDIYKQPLKVEGKVRLNLRWQDESGNKYGTRVTVFVVYGLGHSVLLSHGFINSHPEVWRLAKVINSLADQINLTWFKKQSEEQQAIEDEFRRRREAENRARDDAEKRERVADLDRRLGRTSSSPTAGSSNTSTSGSTQGPSSGLAQGSNQSSSKP